MAKKTTAISVPFEEIHADLSFNSRTDYDDIEGLKESIMGSGLLQPIGVTPIKGASEGTEKYHLVYGFRRYKAMQMIREELGDDAFSTIDVRLNEGTIEELRVRNLKENIDRKNLKPAEIAQAIKRMANAGLEQRDIAARLGRPQAWVSYHYKAATKLSPPAWTAFADSKLTLEQALNIADVPEEDQPEIVEQVLNAESRSEARDITKKASVEKGKRRKYKNKGRPTVKQAAQYVSDSSFDALSSGEASKAFAFRNGMAAAFRVMLGDLEFEGIKTGDNYTDVDFHDKFGKVKKDAAGEAEASDDTDDDDTDQ